MSFEFSSSVTVSKLFFGTFSIKTFGSKGVGDGFFSWVSTLSLVNMSNSSSIFGSLLLRVSALFHALSGSNGVVLGIKIFLLKSSFGSSGLVSCSKFSLESLLYIDVWKEKKVFEYGKMAVG